MVKMRLYCTRGSWSVNQMHQDSGAHPSHGSSPQARPQTYGQSSYGLPASSNPEMLSDRTFTGTKQQSVPPSTPAPPPTGLLEDIPISPIEYEAHSRTYSSSEGGYEQRLRIGSAAGVSAHVTRLTGRPNFEEIFKGKGSPLRDGGDVAVCGKLLLSGRRDGGKSH